MSVGRCSKGVDRVFDGSSKLLAIAEETNHQIMHRRRCGKAHRATHQTLDPDPQMNVLALDFLRMLLVNLMLLWVDMLRVSPPSIGVTPSTPARYRACRAQAGPYRRSVA
jgi:hypothetical protein